MPKISPNPVRPPAREGALPAFLPVDRLVKVPARNVRVSVQLTGPVAYLVPASEQQCDASSAIGVTAAHSIVSPIPRRPARYAMVGDSVSATLNAKEPAWRDCARVPAQAEARPALDLHGDSHCG